MACGCYTGCRRTVTRCLQPYLWGMACGCYTGCRRTVTHCLQITKTLALQDKHNFRVRRWGSLVWNEDH